MCVRVQGHIRFTEENGATKGLEGLTAAASEGGKPQLCGAEVELRILDGMLVYYSSKLLVILTFGPFR